MLQADKRTERECYEYRKRIENKPQLNWYTVYDKNIKSIRGLAKKVMAVNEQSIENINENIYGLLSAYAHGLFSGDGFYFGEDKKMKFLPFRYNNGGGARTSSTRRNKEGSG